MEVEKKTARQSCEARAAKKKEVHTDEQTPRGSPVVNGGVYGDGLA